MTIFTQLWARLDRVARISLTFFLVVLAAATIGLSLWLLKPDYQVLFGDLAATDAATMVAELDKMKVPYKLDGGGGTILVRSEDVYKTRLKLVGHDIPLHGTVGFELFNNADIGMTEFAQKVNYQRALQGELTRTILSIEEIQAARVHLAQPDQGLFKKAGTQAKASVSLTLKPGKTLSPRQVQGIQRLVAASVPDIHEEDVTVIDQHGVALTRAAGGDGENGEPGSTNLENKEALERYLTRKVTDVLDRTFGAGQSIASVDVVFNRDMTKVTTENVLGANGTADHGVITHQKETAQEPAAEAPGSQTHVAPASNTSHEVDYQVGRRVEQTVTTPGAVARINVAVVVRQTLDSAQIERIRDVVNMAAGINRTRGDSVAVYSVAQFGASSQPAANPAIPDSTADDSPAQPAQPVMTIGPDAHGAPPVQSSRPLFMLALICLVFLAMGFLLWRGSRQAATQRELSPQERDEVLNRVRHWLDAAPAVPGDEV
ncbi:MAG: flagellar M-ring protein FliF [Burkholderiales bacterium]|nr:flagellar M-ring protein FliF [Burkholderiales bacterium]